MRILYAYDMVLPSTDTDAEQVLSTVSALGRRGLDVEILLPGPRGVRRCTADELRDRYQVAGPFRVSYVRSHFDARRPLQKLAHGIAAARWPRARSFDLVYTRNLAVLGACLQAGHRVAYEHFRRWPDQYPPLQPLLRKLLLHPLFVGAVLHSDHAREGYASLGVPDERLVTIHNGYEPSRVAPALTVERARAALDLPAERRIVTYAGHVDERKGLDVVLEMARRCPEVLFVLVGSEGDGPVEREARGIPNVLVVPWQPFDRTATYLYAADLLILPPSLRPLRDHGDTVLPLKLFLYLATGRPVLGAETADLVELLEDDANAILVRPDDPAGAAATLRRALADPERLVRIGRAGRESARDLTWDARAEKLERFLLASLARGGAPASEAAGRWSRVRWLAQTASWVRRRLP